MLEANRSYHASLNSGLDMFQQEYELRKIQIPKNVSSDIAVLRNLIQTTVGEEFLYERFKVAVANMWTWEDVFSYFSSNDLTTKNYMFIVLNSLSKDRAIVELKEKICSLNELLSTTVEQHRLKLDGINKLHNEEMTALQKGFEAKMQEQKKLAENSQKEIMLLKQQVNFMQERLMLGDNSKIEQLTKQNSEQLAQIALLQKEILHYRNKDRLLLVADAKPSIRRDAQGQVHELLSHKGNVTPIIDQAERKKSTCVHTL